MKLLLAFFYVSLCSKLDLRIMAKTLSQIAIRIAPSLVQGAIYMFLWYLTVLLLTPIISIDPITTNSGYTLGNAFQLLHLATIAIHLGIYWLFERKKTFLFGGIAVAYILLIFFHYPTAHFAPERIYRKTILKRPFFILDSFTWNYLVFATALVVFSLFYRCCLKQSKFPWMVYVRSISSRIREIWDRVVRVY